MNFYKNLIALFSGPYIYERSNACSNATSKFPSLIGLIDEKSLNDCFDKSIAEFCNDKKENIEEEKTSEFIQILKNNILTNGLSFQFKNEVQNDYKFDESGNLVTIETNLYDVYTELFLNAMDMPEMSIGFSHIERILYKMKRNAIKEIKEKESI
jgi:hypothetical protein